MLLQVALAALLGILNLGFCIWSLQVAARESTAHTDDDYEVFVAIRDTPVRHERDSDASSVATIAQGTRVFVRLQRASSCCRPALSTPPPCCRLCLMRCTSQVWEKGNDFKTGEVKLQIERSSDSVTVTVCECQQLRQMDGLTSKNDAYVVVTLNDREPQRTPTLANTKNPKWNESNELKFEGVDKINKLTVAVFDEDKIGDDEEIGSVTLVSDGQRDGQIDPGILGLEEKERVEAWVHPENRWFLLQREDYPREEGDLFPLHGRITSNAWVNDPWHALFRAHEVRKLPTTPPQTPCCQCTRHSLVGGSFQWVDLQEEDFNGHIRTMSMVRLDEKSACHAPVAFDWRAEVITGHPIFQVEIDTVGSQGQAAAKVFDSDDGSDVVSFDVNPLSMESDTANDLSQPPENSRNPELLNDYIRENFKSDGGIYTETDEGFSTFNFGGLGMKDEDLLELLPHLVHAESPEFISFAGNEQLTDASFRPLFHTLKLFPELSLLASGATGHHSWMWAVQSAMWQTEEYKSKFSKQMGLVTAMRAANGNLAESDKTAATKAIKVHESGIGEALARKKLHLTHAGIEELVQRGLETPEAVDATAEEELIDYGVDIIAARDAYIGHAFRTQNKGIDEALARKKLHLTHTGIMELVRNGLDTPEAVDGTTEEKLVECGVDIVAARKAFIEYEIGMKARGDSGILGEYTVVHRTFIQVPHSPSLLLLFCSRLSLLLTALNIVSVALRPLVDVLSRNFFGDHARAR